MQQKLLFKKAVYYKLVAKVNAIKVPSTSGLVSKTQYDSNKQDPEKKIENVKKKKPDTSELIFWFFNFSAEVIEIENKIPITGLVLLLLLMKKL